MNWESEIDFIKGNQSGGRKEEAGYSAKFQQSSSPPRLRGWDQVPIWPIRTEHLGG